MKRQALVKLETWGWICVCIIMMAGISWGEWINTSGLYTDEPVTATVQRSDESGTDFSVSVNGLMMEDLVIEGESYSKLSIPGQSATWQVGHPELPKVVKVIAIPATGNVELYVEPGSFTIYEGINIPPAQEEDLWDVAGAGDQLYFDDVCYEENAFYPSTLAEISEPMVARDLRIVAVTMYPVQYNPVTKQLRVYSDLSVSVVHTGGTGVNEKQIAPRTLSRAMLPFYRSEVLNFDELGLDEGNSQAGTILIICYNVGSVLTEVNIIAEWKRKKGFNTVVATTSVTGTTSSQIYNYILNMYNDPNQDPPLEYVMMVGDGSGTYSVAANSSYSDYGYSLLEGGDIIAEVAIGRLSFSTITELRIIRRKILKYESDPYIGGSNPDWFQDAWMYAGVSSSVTSSVHTKEYVRNLLYNAGYHNINLDTHSGAVSESLIQNRLNAGVSIWNHRPAWIGQIYSTHVDELNNGWMMPVCLNLTCSTGNWVSSTAVSETLLRGGSVLQPQGAIAAIATATSSTHTQYNNAFDGSFFHALITLGQYHVGDALAVGKAHFMWQYQGSGTAQNYCHWNNLMGDPSLEVWTSTPGVISADYPSTISVGTNMITVSVDDGSSQPLEGAYVHAYKPGETFIGDFTGSNGRVTLPITATTVDTIFITVTGHKYKPVVGYALVQSSPHNVAPLTVVIDDDNTGYSQGNGDGEANPGEALEVNVTLKNWGYQSVSGVSATMSTTSSYVTSIDNATVSYGTIAAGGEVTPVDDFELTLAPTIPDDYNIQLLLVITDNTLTTYRGVVVLEIKEIALEYVDHNWLNAGNGVLDPGEIVNLEVTLRNIGQVDAPTGITGIVELNHPLLTILDPTGTWSAMVQGATATNSGDLFQIQADSYMFAGTPFQINLLMENASGFRDTITINDRIGIADVTDPLGPDAYGYYAFDNGDTRFSKRPFYSWVEIDPGHGGLGTVLNLPDYGENQDASVPVSLLFDIQYYGLSFNRITVCSNGWLAFGDQSNIAHADNWRIPGALGALSQVSALWDDLNLYSSGDGRVWQYYDAANHRFIIEWSRVYNRANGNRETFEVILFDEAYYPTPTGDAEILIQYQDITSGINASVGIDNQDQTIGMEYYFNNTYPTPAAPPMDSRAILFTTDPGMITGPAQIIVNPLSVSESAAPGGSAEAVVTIGNIGESNLDYSVSVNYTLDSGIDLSHGTFPLPGGVDDFGGPDAFGYVWMDSDEPGGPGYQWVDITGIGTPIQWPIDPDDKSFGPLSIGFGFPFYGTIYDSLRICSNGFISFTDNDTTWSNANLPSVSAPLSLLAVWWDDLNPEHGGNFYYWSNQVDTFIVTIDSIQGWGEPTPRGGPYFFQVILIGSGKIKYQYQEMGTIRLDEATIGIQNETGTIGLTVTHNSLYVHDELAVEFSIPVLWLDVTPLTGSVATGELDSLHLTMDGSQLEVGTHQANVIINNSDPVNPAVVVPVTFTILGGSAPPAAVGDLMIGIVSGNAALSWSAVAEDTLGNPITIEYYVIYSSPDDPYFVPTSGDSIGYVTPPGTTFLDVDALTDPKRFYNVKAVVDN